MKLVIKPLILFLEGKKGKIIKNYELRIKNLEKSKNANPLIRRPNYKCGSGESDIMNNANAANGEANYANDELANLKFQLRT